MTRAPFTKTSPGEPRTFYAEEFNAFLDNTLPAQRQGKKARNLIRPGSISDFVNGTLGTVFPNDVIALDDSHWSITSNGFETFRQPKFLATLPSSAANQAVGVVDSATSVGENGKAIVDGIAVCRVDRTDSSHNYACWSTTGGTSYLASETSGPVKLLYVDTANPITELGQTVYWAIVQLGVDSSAIAGQSGCRDPFWYGESGGVTLQGARSNDEVEFEDNTSSYPLFLTENNGVTVAGDRLHLETGFYYRLEATVMVEVFSQTAQTVEAFAYWGGWQAGGSEPFDYRNVTFSAADSSETPPYDVDNEIRGRGHMTLSATVPPDSDLIVFIEVGFGVGFPLRPAEASAEATVFFYTRDIVVTKLVDCAVEQAPVPPIIPGDLCDLTTTAYLWQADSNFVDTSDPVVWSVSDAACTSGVTWEEAAADAPDDSSTINGNAVLTFDGTENLDLTGTTELEVSDTATLKELWVSFKFAAKNNTDREAIFGDNTGSADRIGRNQFGYLETRFNSNEDEWGKICLQNTDAHVLRFEATSTANEYIVTMDDYHQQTITVRDPLTIDRIGESGLNTLHLEGQIMDVYVSEAQTDLDAATLWTYFMDRIAASASFFQIPDPTFSDVALRDQFLTTDAAPITTVRTCEPGPGTLTWDTGDEAHFSIANQQLELSGGVSVLTERGFWGDAFTRQAGLRMEVQCEMDDATEAVCYIGWLDSTSAVTGSMIGGFRFSNDINSHHGYAHYFGGLTSADEFEGYHVGFETDIFISVVLRSTGAHVFASHCGQLKHIIALNLGSTATVYPGLVNATGNFDIDFFRVRGSTWTPTPICSDSFTRADSSSIGSTDDAGAEETGGATLDWTETPEGSGDAEIMSNRLSNQQTGAGDNVFCTVDASEADITSEFTLYAGDDWVGVVVNWQDASNYWLVVLNTTSGGGNGLTGSSGADYLELFEIIGGSVVGGAPHASTNISSITTGEDFYLWVHTDDDTIAAEIMDATGTQSTFSVTHTENDRSLKTETKHGVYLSSKGTNAAECSRFVLWPRNVTDYDEGTSGSIAAPSPPASMRSYVTVAVNDDDPADYRCDGTDDDVQIQAAFDEVESAGGGTVFIKGGTYDIGAVLDIADDTELDGTPNTILKKQDSSGTDNVINVVSRSNVRIRNLQVDGNKANNAASDYFNINVFESSEVTIDNVTTYNANRASTEGEGIRIAGSDHVTCYMCRAHDNGGVGIKWTTSSSGTNRSQYATCTFCEAWDNGSDGLLMFEVDGSKMNNNVAHGNGDDGITLHGEETTDTGPKYSEICNNVSHSNTEDGIVACTSGDSCNCSDNLSYANGEQGINYFFHAKHNTVNSNICKFNGFDGIFMQGQSATPPLKPSRFADVCDNMCFDNGYAGSIYSGIRVAFGSLNLNLDSNTCTCTDSDNPNGTPPNQRYGINIQDEYCVGTRVTNNVLTGNRLGGLNDSGTNTFAHNNKTDDGPGSESGVWKTFLPENAYLKKTDGATKTTRSTGANDYDRDVLVYPDSAKKYAAWKDAMPPSFRQNGAYIDVWLNSLNDVLEPSKIHVDVAWARNRVNESDLDIDGFDTEKGVTIFSHDTNDTLVLARIEFDGDEMDNIRPDEPYWLQVAVDPTVTNAVTGDVHVHYVQVRQRACAIESLNRLDTLVTESIIWQADTNYATNGANEQWKPVNKGLLRFERATATAPSTREINGRTALDFQGAERLDGWPTTTSPLFPIGIKDTGTTHQEIWISFQFDAATGEEYLITGDDGGTADGIGRNSSDELVIRMSDTDTDFTNIDLGDTDPHVLRIENTGTAGEYKCTLDEGTPQTLTLGGSGEVVIEGLGVQQDGTNFFDGAIMHLWLVESLTTAQADYAWDYLRRQIGS